MIFVQNENAGRIYIVVFNKYFYISCVDHIKNVMFFLQT